MRINHLRRRELITLLGGAARGDHASILSLPVTLLDQPVYGLYIGAD
jgi:hypothetical protein